MSRENRQSDSNRALISGRERGSTSLPETTAQSGYGASGSTDLEIPEPIISDQYLQYTDTDQQIRESLSRGPPVSIAKKYSGLLKNFRDRRLRRGSFDVPPVDTFGDQLPRTSTGQLAVYGQHQDQPIHGPVNWEQYYGEYSRIGDDFRPPSKSLFMSKLSSRTKLAETISLREKQLKFLEDQGYTFKRMLGKGGYGEVWEVKQKFELRSDGQKVPVNRRLACKLISLRRMQIKQYSVQQSVNIILHEAQVYVELDHPNIVKQHIWINIMDEKSGFPQPIHVLLFMELMDGDLNGLIHQRNRTPEEFEQIKQKSGWQHSPEQFTVNLAKQIASALKYLHDREISHLDLKPGNILYRYLMDGQQNRLVFKLTDFGLAVRSINEVKSIKGTKKYAPPESTTGQFYDPKLSDIYSFGLVLAKSVAGDAMPMAEAVQCLQNYDSKAQSVLKVSIECAQLIAWMTNSRAEYRPNITQIFNHYWLLNSFPYVNPEDQMTHM